MSKAKSWLPLPWCFGNAACSALGRPIGSPNPDNTSTLGTVAKPTPTKLDSTGQRASGSFKRSSNAERILVSSHNDAMRRSRLKPGMDLAVRKGELGNAASVPAGIEQANCSSEVMFFEVNERVGSGFLCAFFNTDPGRKSFLRQQRGMMIAGISLLDVPKIQVPYPHSDAQAYIGNKVRQAEALRARAKASQGRAQEMVEALFPTMTRPADNRQRLTASRVAPNILLGRLNAQAYAPEHLADIKDLAKCGMRLISLDELVSAPINNSTRNVDDLAEQCYWLARVLPTAARFLVEALIEQKVGEADLIAAHKNADRDRALLGRLTTKGLDVPDAPPLLPDLDALYALLQPAEVEED